MRGSDYLALTITLWATAGLVYADDCKNIADDGARLNCYDVASGRASAPALPASAAATSIAGSKPAQQAGKDDEWWSLKRLSIRNQGTFSKPGTDPAILSFARNNGSDSSLVQAAILYAAPVLPIPETELSPYQPFLSYSINRDALTNPKTDVRDAQAGIAHEFGTGDTGLALVSTITVGERSDHIQHQSSAIVTLQNQLVIPQLANTAIIAPDGKSFVTPYQIFPLFGYFYQNKQVVSAGQQTGHRDGPYVGLSASFAPGAYISWIGERFTITGTFQSYWDVSAVRSVGKQTLRYTTISLSYLLSKEVSWFKPYLFIERDIGSDPVGGTFSANRTLVGLKASLN